MSHYVTRAGDTVDWIAWRFYGADAARAVEQVLAANPGLADPGPLLPAGLVIELPAIEEPAEQGGVRLWD